MSTSSRIVDVMSMDHTQRSSEKPPFQKVSKKGGKGKMDVPVSKKEICRVVGLSRCVKYKRPLKWIVRKRVGSGLAMTRTTKVSLWRANHTNYYRWTQRERLIVPFSSLWLSSLLWLYMINGSKRGKVLGEPMTRRTLTQPMALVFCSFVGCFSTVVIILL